MGKTENAMISGSPSPLHRAANKPSWTSNSKPGPSRGNQVAIGPAGSPILQCV